MVSQAMLVANVPGMSAAYENQALVSLPVNKQICTTCCTDLDIWQVALAHAFFVLLAFVL